MGLVTLNEILAAESTTGWQEIGENEPLVVGDIVKQVYHMVAGPIYVQAALWGQAERNIEGNPNFRLLSVEYPYKNDPNMVAFEIEIVPAAPEVQMAVCTPLLILGIALLGMAGIFGMMEHVTTLLNSAARNRLTQTPSGMEILKTEVLTAAEKPTIGAGLAGIGSALPIVAVAIIVWVLAKKRG